MAQGNNWLFRLFIVIAGALVVIPILITGRLVEERQKHYRQLRRSERELRQLSNRLELALDASQIGVWEHGIDTGEVIWDDRLSELYGSPDGGGKREHLEWANAVHPEDIQRAERDFKIALETGERYTSDFMLCTRTGKSATCAREPQSNGRATSRRSTSAPSGM